MNLHISDRSPSSHPLSGLEAWPRTGPVYGFADDENRPRPTGFWQRISDRLRKAPSSESSPGPQVRIWY